MKTWKSFVGLFFTLATLSSCTFYNPIYTNTPTYDEAGEVNLGVNLGTSADINFSTNPVEHLSIIADASYSGNISNQSGRFADPNAFELYDFNRYQLQAGVGYYYYLMENLQHDFHIGYGIGKGAETYNLGAIQSDFSNLFIQSSLVFKLDNHFKGIFSSKFNRLTFTDFSYARGSQFDTPPVFNDTQTYWLNQFGAGFVIPYGPLELNMQAQINLRFDNTIDQIDRPIGVYLGITFNVDQIVNGTE